MSLSSIGLSGMRAAQMQLDTTAHNVANAQTPNFRRQAVTQTAQPGVGGATSEIVRQPEAASINGAGSAHLVEDLVTQKMAVYSFAANLRTVQTEDHMLGTLLDQQA
jgi:flagellar hook-associated protein FlgK